MRRSRHGCRDLQPKEVCEELVAEEKPYFFIKFDRQITKRLGGSGLIRPVRQEERGVPGSQELKGSQ